MALNEYYHLVDYERKSQGLGSPPGRISHKIPRFIITHEDNKEIRTPRSQEDIQQDKSKLKMEQIKKNHDFVTKTGYRPRAVQNTQQNNWDIPIDKPNVLNQIPNLAQPQQQIMYNPLKLILDTNTGNTCAIFGSSKRGKSTVLMQIYRDYYMNQAPSQIVPILFAKSSQLPQYNLPHLIKTSVFKPEVIKYQQRINKYSNNKHNFVNFIDDFINLKHCLTLDDLMLTFRNSNISTYICLQYVNILSKPARSNVNNVLLFGQNTDEAAEQSITVYLTSYFKKLNIPKHTWVQYFHQVTQDHGFFHIHPATGVVTICKATI